MLISNIAIRRPVFTTMVILAMLVFGVYSFMNLGIDLLPKIEFPVITITSVLKGADPETIESRVTDPIEEAVNTIASIKSLRSTSADSVSLVVIEFELDKNIDVAFQEVQAKVNAVRSALPNDLDEPVIDKIDPDAQPIMTLIVSADLPARELSRVADKVVKEQLQHVRNIGSVQILGKRERKIWLWLDPLKMRQHSLTVQDVRGALQREHVEVPGGRVETGPMELVTRTKAEFKDAAEMEGLIIVERGGRTIRLRDVGRAEDGIDEERTYAQMNARPCLALDVRRQSGTNTVQVAKDVKKEIERLNKDLEPQGVRIDIAKDNSVYIEQSVSEVKHHLLTGGLMAVLTVLIFLLNFRSTFISALVLPTSIISTFMVISLMGFTLNVITLLALTLAVGLLIDDSIVVQENIMRHVQSGKPAREAAAFATSEIGLAVIATTLSVVAVFIPVATTKGIVGRFFFPFGITVAFAVMISMFVSFTLDPMLSSRMLRRRIGENRLVRFLEGLFLATERRYEKVLGWALRHRAATLGIGAAAFVVAAALFPLLKTEFMPTEDQSEFNVMVRAPLGASLDRTRGIMESIRARVSEIPEVAYTYYSVGSDALQKVNEGAMYVKLVDKAKRGRSQEQVMEAARKALEDLPGEAKIAVQMAARMSGGGMKWAQVQYEVRGPDQDRLNGIAARVLDRMREKGGYVDLDTSYESGKPEADVFVDRDRAADLGVAPVDIADTLRAAVGGAVVGKFKAGSDRYDIAVRFLEQYRNRPELINDLLVPSRKGGLVELRNVARVEKTGIPVEITRYNRQRNVTVLANLEKGKKTGDAVKEIDAIAKEAALPSGYSTGWVGMAQMMQDSFRYLGETMILAIIVVFLVLASQFESLVHPFTIMLTLPLAMVGALMALVLTGGTQSVFTMIAFIFLLGLVTKNAILLIDFTNTLRRRDGLSRDQALKKAGPVRLRPILMTTMAMIMGMLPTALGTGSGSESRRPMAIAIIGGLITSTLLTLIVVPVVYTLLDPVSEWIDRRVINPKGASAPAAEPIAKDQPRDDGV
jgi:hydrophobic/amphiphilic exporter-1 (mainly G- bacteria), HAE1 family